MPEIINEDEHAVEALAAVIDGPASNKNSRNGMFSLRWAQAKVDARRILAAIRLGEIPTICNLTTNEMTLAAERDQLRAEVERLRADRDKCQRNEDEVGDRLEKAEAEVGRLNQQIKDERAAMWSHLMDLLRLIDPEADPHYEDAYADLHAGITDLRDRAEKAESDHAEAVALLREIEERLGATAAWSKLRIDAHLAACDGKGVGG